jgi:hypothetical protein
MSGPFRVGARSRSALGNRSASRCLRFEAVNRASVMGLVVEMDDVAQDVMGRVDQNDMSANCYILVMARRGWQAVPEIRRYGVSPPAKVPVERFAG